MLMYHALHASRVRERWPWSISEDDFVDHLDFLQGEGWVTITQGDLVKNETELAPRTVVITFDDGYVDNLRAFEQLARRGMCASWFIVSGSIGSMPSWSGDGQPSGRMLNEHELRMLHASGMEIGSHTANHVRLTELDDGSLSTELHVSKSILEDILGTRVNSFAYPYGAFDERSMDAVRHAGYRSACTTRTGWARLDRSPFLLRRLSIFNGDTASRLARKISLGTNDASWKSLMKYAGSRIRSRIGL